MDIHIRRVRGTPYKLVFANGNHDPIGAFDHGKYVAREYMSDKLKNVADQFHADTFLERIGEEVATC